MSFFDNEEFEVWRKTLEQAKADFTSGKTPDITNEQLQLLQSSLTILVAQFLRPYIVRRALRKLGYDLPLWKVRALLVLVNSFAYPIGFSFTSGQRDANKLFSNLEAVQND